MTLVFSLFFAGSYQIATSHHGVAANHVENVVGEDGRKYAGEAVNGEDWRHACNGPSAESAKKKQEFRCVLMLFADYIKPCDELWNHHQAKREIVISKAHCHLLFSSRSSFQIRSPSFSVSISRAKMITTLISHTSSRLGGTAATGDLS